MCILWRLLDDTEVVISTKMQMSLGQLWAQGIRADEMYPKLECVLYVHHQHIPAYRKHLNISISFPSEAAQHVFVHKYVSGIHLAIKYNIL